MSQILTVDIFWPLSRMLKKPGCAFGPLCKLRVNRSWHSHPKFRQTICTKSYFKFSRLAASQQLGRATNNKNAEQLIFWDIPWASHLCCGSEALSSSPDSDVPVKPNHSALVRKGQTHIFILGQLWGWHLVGVLNWSQGFQPWWFWEISCDHHVTRSDFLWPDIFWE